MTQLSFYDDAPHSGYRVTNQERFRRTAHMPENTPDDEPDEMAAVRLTTEIIREYAGDRAECLLNVSRRTLETAALWDEAGYEPPHDVKLLVEILHRIHSYT